MKEELNELGGSVDEALAKAELEDDLSDRLRDLGVKTLEAMNPDSQKWQLWPKHALQSYAACPCIDLSDSDVEVECDGREPR